MFDQATLGPPPRKGAGFDLTVRTLVGLNLFIMLLSFIPDDFHRGNMPMADELFYQPDLAGFRLDYVWLPVSTLALLMLLIFAWIPARSSSWPNTALCLLGLISFVAFVFYSLFTLFR